MKLTDKLVEKVGADRLLHFFVAAWLVSECKAFGIIAAFFSWIAVIILSAVKEYFLDDEPEPMELVRHIPSQTARRVISLL